MHFDTVQVKLVQTKTPKYGPKKAFVSFSYYQNNKQS